MTTRQERLSRRSRRLEATAVSVAVALTALLYQLVPQAAATAPGWSNRSPCFFPEWVDKIEAPLPN